MLVITHSWKGPKTAFFRFADQEVTEGLLEYDRTFERD